MAGISLFAALAIVLNLAHIQVPFPPLNYLIYEFWEIPIVVCLLIFGFSAALTASVINTIILLFVNPGASASGPIYNLIAVTLTLLAIVAGNRVTSSVGLSLSSQIIIATTLAVLVRTAGMSVVNYALLPYPPPLGFSIPVKGVIAILPLIALFNATLALYTVPIGYIAARAVMRRIHFKLAYAIQPTKVKS